MMTEERIRKLRTRLQEDLMYKIHNFRTDVSAQKEAFDRDLEKFDFESFARKKRSIKTLKNILTLLNWILEGKEENLDFEGLNHGHKTEREGKNSDASQSF